MFEYCIARVKAKAGWVLKGLLDAWEAGVAGAVGRMGRTCYYYYYYYYYYYDYTTNDNNDNNKNSSSSSSSRMIIIIIIIIIISSSSRNGRGVLEFGRRGRDPGEGSVGAAEEPVI